jgi:hypothetical protein
VDIAPASNTLAAPGVEFVPCEGGFEGAREGFFFGTGNLGLGYYLDLGLMSPAIDHNIRHNEKTMVEECAPVRWLGEDSQLEGGDLQAEGATSRSEREHDEEQEHEELRRASIRHLEAAVFKLEKQVRWRSNQLFLANGTPLR